MREMSDRMSGGAMLLTKNACRYTDSSLFNHIIEGKWRGSPLLAYTDHDNHHGLTVVGSDCEIVILPLPHRHMGWGTTMLCQKVLK